MTQPPPWHPHSDQPPDLAWIAFMHNQWKRNKFSFFSPSKLIAKISLFIGRQMAPSSHAGPCLLWRVLQCKYQIWTNNDSFSLAYDGSVHLQFCLHTFLSTDDPGSAAEQSAINVHLKFLFSLFTIYTVQWEETGRYLYCQAQVHVQVHVRWGSERSESGSGSEN